MAIGDPTMTIHRVYRDVTNIRVRLPRAPGGIYDVRWRQKSDAGDWFDDVGLNVAELDLRDRYLGMFFHKWYPSYPRHIDFIDRLIGKTQRPETHTLFALSELAASRRNPIGGSVPVLLVDLEGLKSNIMARNVSRTDVPVDIKV